MSLNTCLYCLLYCLQNCLQRVVKLLLYSQHIHSPCTSTCATHPAIPSQLPSTTLLCTQLANTKHSRQNSTRCRDGVNVLWCHSHLVWLILEGSIPTCACFIWKKIQRLMLALCKDSAKPCIAFQKSIVVSPNHC